MNFQSYKDQFVEQCPFKIKTAYNGAYYKDESINDTFDGINIYQPAVGNFNVLKFQFKVTNQNGQIISIDDQLLDRLKNSVLDSLFYRLFYSFEQLALGNVKSKPQPNIGSLADFSNLFNAISTQDTPESRVMLPVSWFSNMIRRLSAFQQFVSLKKEAKKNMRTALRFGPRVITPPSRVISKILIFAYDYSLVVSEPDFKINGNIIEISIGYDIQDYNEISLMDT